MAIELQREDLKRMEQHGAETYPDECCGILLGRERGGRKVIAEVFPARNARADSARNRYLIPPADLLRSLEEAEKKGLEILGFYHSHPDQPAQPSAFDRQYAWPWFAYLIVEVRNRIARETTAWTLAVDGSEFLREELMVLGDPSGPLIRPGSGP
ncbi:MAG TPA: M67 family metallopeptidase [Terriglobia bacterium]|nr:M67 family metallopeptidase [Terriglobia bacterium]